MLTDKDVGKANRMACAKTWRHKTTWHVGVIRSEITVQARRRG